MSHKYMVLQGYMVFMKNVLNTSQMCIINKEINTVHRTGTSTRGYVLPQNSGFSHNAALNLIFVFYRAHQQTSTICVIYEINNILLNAALAN